MLVFGVEWDRNTECEIEVVKEGKYLYMEKPFADENKKYRMDLTSGEFQRINEYKTTGVKINDVEVRNITSWFSDCSIFCEDDKFTKVMLYSKLSHENNKFKSNVRFIEGLVSWKTRNYEKWLSIGIEISEFKKKIDKYKQQHSRYSSEIYSYTRIVPTDFSKQNLKWIKKNYDELSLELINTLHDLDSKGYDLKLIQKMHHITSKPPYKDLFKASSYTYGIGNLEYNVFDINLNQYSYSDIRLMKKIIECITKFNLDIDAFLRFCLRMHNVEGVGLSELFGANHYNDYLQMEKRLKNNRMTKVDKYPQHFLSTFHITKREYGVRQQEFKEEDFRQQCDKFRYLEQEFKKYSIIVPKQISEIEEEADELKHCVRMYIPQVVDGSTLICFLRDNEELETPLITIEVKDGYVTQAYGVHDGKPSDEQLEVMRKWAKDNSLKLSWVWG